MLAAMLPHGCVANSKKEETSVCLQSCHDVFLQQQGRKGCKKLEGVKHLCLAQKSKLWLGVHGAVASHVSILLLCAHESGLIGAQQARPQRGNYGASLWRSPGPCFQEETAECTSERIESLSCLLRVFAEFASSQPQTVQRHTPVCCLPDPQKPWRSKLGSQQIPLHSE